MFYLPINCLLIYKEENSNYTEKDMDNTLTR